MSRHFNPDTERHFYFGDVFFKQFVGIFDQGAGAMGIAQSANSVVGVSLACPGTSCSELTEEPELKPSTPDDPTPDPSDDTPSEQGGSTTEDWWLWIVIGLSVLVLIFFIWCCYYRRKSKKNEEFNAMLYATPANHDGDMI